MRLLMRGTVLALAGAALIGTAPAQVGVQLTADVTLAGPEVRFTGRISDEAVERLESLLRSPAGAQVTRLRIESGGGSGLAGIRLGHIVHARALDLVVNRVCGSACAIYVVPAARSVTVEGDALILFHRFASPLLRQLLTNDLQRQVDPAARQRVTEAIATVNRLIPAQEDFYRTIGVNPELMNRTIAVWVALNRYVQARGTQPAGADILLAPDRTFMRECLRLTNGAWRDFKIADSIVHARIAGNPVGYLVDGRLYFEGTEVPNARFHCTQPGIADALPGH